MIQSIANWKTNAALIRDCATLGYLPADGIVLDTTFGYGAFWHLWEPKRLVTCDLDVKKARMGGGVQADFCKLPFPRGAFDAVVFDPPYKLNGAPTDGSERYGVDSPARWQDRMQLVRFGLDECARVLAPFGFLLLKCQDQVCAGKKRWQTLEFANKAATLGLGLVDRFDFVTGGRPQPSGRRQVHSHANASQLLVFKRGW